MKTRRTYFGKCLSFLLQKHGYKQAQLAALSGVDQSTISYLITRDKRPDDAIARSLCACWPTHEDNIRLLIEGVRDVIQRWGHDPEQTIELRALDAPTPQTDAERDIAVILRHMADDGVSDLLHDIAVILTRAERKPEWSTRSAEQAAEPPSNDYCKKH